MTQTTFYFDLGSPFAYLAAARVPEVLREPVTWQPVSLGALFKLNGRSSWSLGDPTRRSEGMAEVEKRASSYGLPPLQWPDPWPTNYLLAMRVATYAFQIERGREFTMRAFEEAFQKGNDLGIEEHVLNAAKEAGLDPAAAANAAGDPEIKQALRSATDAAHQLGVFGVPTISVDGELLWGDDRLQEAAALQERTAG
jgi:2-hydroxychromene-2-carboxylate isomerase